HVDNEKLSEYIRAYVIDDPSMFENSMEDVRHRVAKTFANRRFRANIERASERNWLQMDVGEAFDAIEGFLKDLERYTK
ncbi:MAG: hypothetical protein J5622_02160, partial [Firmicutes bacterium]|nr:hypothetical protein [Bacillota bacterium]